MLSLEFKITILALYCPYDRVTGPYLRKDGRKKLDHFVVEFVQVKEINVFK